jgi:NAD(P)-dependent dehydrogenase (short-subunit alcohol dehydrogenase family)
MSNLRENNMQELAIIAGATGEFGKEITKSMLAAGLKVIAIGRNIEELEKLAAQFGNIIPCAADLSNDSAIDKIKSAIHSPVKIIVNSAGVPVAGGIIDAQISAMSEAVNLKVGGFLRMVRAADKYLQKHSRLVAIGGHYGLEPTSYAATAGIGNAALINVSRQLSLAYGSRGITSHIIAPGPADTPRLRNVANARAQRDGISIDQVLEEMAGESSLGAFTTPRQVAWAVSILLNQEADAMTGSTLMLDSGRRKGLP